MRLPSPLVKARLIKRYKRFLADAEILSTGEIVTAHLANPGSMLSLLRADATIWLSRADNPARKLRWDWRLVALENGALSGVSTAHPNKLVGEALADRRLAPFADYPVVQPEQRYGEGSRVDFLLTGGGPDLYLEVKNVHLRREDDWAEFPDSVTARGAKHLRELSAMVAAGARAAMVYIVQRDDCARLRMAADLDPAYAEAFAAARAAGVEAYAYGCRFDLNETPENGAECEITIGEALPIAD